MMSITPRSVTGNFDDYVYDLLRGQIPINGVTFEGYREDFYYDTLGIPTVGVGTALIFKDGSTYSVRTDLSTVFSGAYTFSPAELTTLSTIASQLTAGNQSGAQATFDSAQSSGQFTDLSPSDVRTVFDNALDANLTTIQGTHGATWTSVQTALAGSKELAAVYSLAYSLPDFVGPGLVDALDSGDRARAWYEILYHHTQWSDSVAMNRHEAEADLFSLVNDGASAEKIALEGDGQSRCERGQR
jgi:hypothetical protein